jgi:hypothetical protein
MPIIHIEFDAECDVEPTSEFNNLVSSVKLYFKNDKFNDTNSIKNVIHFNATLAIKCNCGAVIDQRIYNIKCDNCSNKDDIWTYNA